MTVRETIRKINCKGTNCNDCDIKEWCDKVFSDLRTLVLGASVKFRKGNDDYNEALCDYQEALSKLFDGEKP